MNVEMKLSDDKKISDQNDLSASSTHSDIDLVVEDDLQYPDGGWAWVITGLGFILYVMGDGFLYSFGIIYVELKNRYGDRSDEVNWIYAIQLFCYCVSTLGAAAMIPRFGARITLVVGAGIASTGLMLSAFVSDYIYLLYLTLGILTGTGLGMQFQIIACMISSYFKKHRGMANGIATSGSGVGMFLFPPLISFLLDEFAFEGACIIGSGIVLHSIACAGLFISPDVALKLRKQELARKAKQKGLSPPPSSQISGAANPSKLPYIFIDVEMLKSKKFHIFLVSNMFLHFSLFVPSNFMPDRANTAGMNRHQQSFLVSAVGVGNLFGRFFFGTISDTKYLKKHRFYLYLGGCILIGVVTIVSFGESFQVQMASSTLYGVFFGLVIGLQCTILSDLIGTSKLSIAFAMMNVPCGMTSLAGPGLCGWVWKKTESFVAVFSIAGGSYIASGLSLIFLMFLSCCRGSRPKLNE